MGRADLHLHTNQSDGVFSPDELVTRASRLNLAAVAITDHDTVEGIPRGLEAAGKYGVEVIPGIELSTNLDNGDLHILGYFIDYKDEALLGLISKVKKSRFDRIVKMVRKLQELGVNISLQKVLSKAKEKSSLGRPHIARVLVESGHVSSIKEAFDKYLGSHCPAYVERYKLEPEEVVNIIKQSGGVPVLAHPGMLSSFEYIERCISAGIQGIEVFHSKHSPEQTREFEIIAKRYSLIPTGGSDCHGEYCGKGLLLGQVTVPYQIVEDLKSTANTNKQGRLYTCRKPETASLPQK